jgi:hypothetical protein
LESLTRHVNETNACGPDRYVDRCYTPESAGERCDSKEIPVIALARAQADSSRPADLNYQTEHSATKLAPQFDYAHAFVAHDRSGIPICAHLRSSFLRSISPTTPAGASLHGHIAGAPGERVYIRPAYPEVCEASAEPGCQGKAYLIPGDRVDVGFICDAWTYIRYVPRTRASNPIYGWVPTAGLYDVDPMVGPGINPPVLPG